MLNRAFQWNHYYPRERVAPFKGILTKERGWLITCNNHYVWSDNRRFLAVKRLTTVYEYPFQFEFDGMRTIRLTKLLLVK